MNLKSLLQEQYKEDITIKEINQFLKDKDLINKNMLTKYVKKSLFDKTASECASWKRKYRAKEKELDSVLLQQTQNTKKQYQQYRQLQKEATIIKYENQYLLLGYDEQLAKESSISLYNGDITTVFNNQNKFVKELKKSKDKEVFE